ncbi:hypothetical protein DICVIV_02401 [Dictyocaulus viviparus]|uniref:Glycosyl hydrolase family 25 n=1 Tax=Dictyocaulus viviparus TaxID=29172 RepID=A0A0D8Y5C0_DICVI|nr:hypothetical protein DICVIV_02401 [Dictyocaulus viviparus]
MFLVLLAISLCSTSTSLHILPQKVPAVENTNGISYALDLSQLVSPTTFQCIRRYGYNVVFLRAYSPYNQGQVDPNIVSNIKNAFYAGLGTEVYMTPQPNSVKTGIQQFDEMYSYLTTSGIKVRTVWIQVTSPINWSYTIARNTNFIRNILNRARQYGVNVGIYTNVYDWNQITNGLVVNNAMLWYWNVFGPGISGESSSDFGDFRSFGGWNKVMVKQFAQVESVCGVTVNRDIYKTASMPSSIGISKLTAPIEKSESMKPQEIVVGGLGLSDTSTFAEKKQ